MFRHLALLQFNDSNLQESRTDDKHVPNAHKLVFNSQNNQSNEIGAHILQKVCKV
jgi:hypothetical protein